MKSILTKAISTLIAACALFTLIPDTQAYADAPRISLKRQTATATTTTTTTQSTESSAAAPARGMHYWDHGISNGFTYGLGMGWYGQYVDGNNTENGLALSMDVGFKYWLFGVEADFDMSISPTDYRDETINTYSFSAMLVGYLPITVS